MNLAAPRKIFSIIMAISIILLGWARCSNHSPAGPEGPLADQLQEILNKTLLFYAGKGVSAAVIMPGRPTWLGVSGESHAGAPIESDMAFCIGSITKTFMAALSLKLSELGVLSLEDSLGRWLPDYANVDNTVTIRQLLNHTSGIFNTSENPTVFNRVFSDLEKIWSPEETITEFVLEPYYAPGTDYHYANTNYILLGMVIEAATGSQVSTVLRQILLEPLELRHTFLMIDENVIGEPAHPWWDYDSNGSVNDLDALSWNADFSTIWTAGSLFSTAEDVANFVHALLEEKIFLDRSSLDQMLDYFPTDFGGYGLGIRTFPEYLDDVEAIGHTGTLWGYSAMTVYLPDYAVSISVLLNNREGEGREAITRALARVVVDELSG